MRKRESPELQQNPSVRIFHAMLKAAIKAQRGSGDIPGLKAALALFEGYFGYFGEK